ncbi:HlyD family secretion protein [Pseudidiomarina taiwanensis]|uniref:Uncharacterized protein n=1 Tax=Pseudidiomarina taiwanensis TaxID=337250 RepID=A0A432ZEY7_9GAMM|nr:HlyD family efflux transporter periplasmic adaptor subunit [Pseudidiomarina taiwanensis]RUO76503.1 hypothetical protein CWI83_09110 [Pseudidiomarina taiwanensis]
MKATTKWSLRGFVVVALLWAGWSYYQQTAQQLPDYIASGNGRIEAVEINIAAKTGGRLLEVYVKEGQWVEQDQLLAQLDTSSIDAELHQAQANLQQAKSAVATANSQVTLRRAELEAAKAMFVQGQAQLKLAQAQLKRTQQLAQDNAISAQELDNAEANLAGAEAAIAASKAQIAAAQAAIVAAQTQVQGAEYTVRAAEAAIERLQIARDEMRLRAPRPGRVQFVIARTGEMVASGGRVMNLMDLQDVYMTFFLPTAVVGKLAIGSEARIVLDAAPNSVIPARISFIADEAQFTPKTVETALEREKLMFRVRASIAPELLRKYSDRVKTGLPGVTYVRTDPGQAWPVALATSVE